MVTFIPFDIEADNLLPDVTKIHCLGVNWGGEIRVTSDYSKIAGVFEKDIFFVGHNVLCYDRPALEKVLKIKIPYTKFIDTLAVSWALYPDRDSHSLDSWGKDLGVNKVEVTDWVGGGEELYKERVTEDIKIQTLLWGKMVTDLNTLYGDKDWLSYVKYLSFKMYVLSVQEKFPFKLDIPKCEANLAELEKLKSVKVDALALAMPPNKKYYKKKRPTKCYKADGSHSLLGAEWFELLRDRGLPEDYDGVVEVVSHEEPPNPSSPKQIKDWLFSLGWKPQTFTDGANGKVAQVKDGDSLCASVLALKEVEPAIEHLDKIGVLGHRIGLLKGFMKEGSAGFITQSAHGFTSTLRLRHRGIVNLPKVSVEYGDMVRGVLTCGDGYEICGADLASLEDRCKQHYIKPLDPKYVEEMSQDGYDSHLSLCVFDGALTPEQAQAHKEKREDHSVIRHTYKQVVYMATYGIGATKLAAYLGVSKSKAKSLIDAYKKLNWAVDVVSNSWERKDALGRKWILNPTNKFWYELRSEKDAFSAVNQSTGSFIFDLWTKYILEQRECLTLQSHDEIATIVKIGNQAPMKKILEESIAKVNKVLHLERDMALEAKFGQNYGSVH